MARPSISLHLCLAVLAMAAAASEAGFYDQFDVVGSGNNVRVNDDGLAQQVALTLDQGNGGSGFSSKDKYLYGEFSVQMKLIGGTSAGTVTTYYVRIYPILSSLITYIYLPMSLYCNAHCMCND